MRQVGLSSDIAYVVSVSSIGASVAAWALSRNFENAPGKKSGRWGVYVGLWAPTFVALGNALKLGEVHSSTDRDRA